MLWSLSPVRDLDTTCVFQDRSHKSIQGTTSISSMRMTSSCSCWWSSMKAGQADDFGRAMERILLWDPSISARADDNTRLYHHADPSNRRDPRGGFHLAACVLTSGKEYVSRVELSLPMKLSTEKFARERRGLLVERWKEKTEPPRLNSDRHAGRWLPIRGRAVSQNVAHRCIAVRGCGQYRTRIRNRQPVTGRGTKHRFFGEEPSDFQVRPRIPAPLTTPREPALRGRSGLDEWMSGCI